MTWVKLDDGFPKHEKVKVLPDRAFRVHIAALCHCSRELTDGFVSSDAIKVMSIELGFACKRHVAALEQAGLWHSDTGGYWINDYLDYNPDAATVKRLRAERRAAGRKGAQKRWSDDGNGYSNGQWQEPKQVLDAPVVVPSPHLKKLLKAVPADQEIEHEVDKILRSITKQDEGTKGVLLSIACKLPISRVAKVRESCAGRTVGAGYAVNALKLELADLEETA
jgi:hypothetical protein